MVVFWKPDSVHDSRNDDDRNLCGEYLYVSSLYIGFDVNLVI